MPVLDAAMSPSAIIGMIETWAYLNTMGISIVGGEVNKVRPKENGKLEVAYQFELVNSTTAETFTATVLGRFYHDDKGEKKYRKLLENLRGSDYFAAGSNLRGFAVYFADGSLRGFAFYTPALRLPFSASMSGLRGLSSGIYCPRPALIHGSLYRAEFLVGENSQEMTIAYFDTFCNADPAIDVGNFLGHLRWKGMQLEWSEEDARRHAKAFLTAYRAEIPPDLMRRIDFYTRVALLWIVARLALQPRNLSLATALLQETMWGCSFK